MGELGGRCILCDSSYRSAAHSTHSSNPSTKFFSVFPKFLSHKFIIDVTGHKNNSDRSSAFDHLRNGIHNTFDMIDQPTIWPKRKMKEQKKKP